MEKYVRIYSLDDAMENEKVCACYPKPMKNVSGGKYEETMIKAEQDAKEGKGDTYNPELGLAMCIIKKMCGNKGNYNNVFNKWLPKED